MPPKKKRLCLVGLGVIAARYRAPLEESEEFSLCAVCDSDPKAVSRLLYEAYPFYTDYRALAKEEKPDFVLISTPPETHFEIALFFLSQGVNVVLEKPAVLSLAALEELEKEAAARGLVLRTLFHWRGGIETLAFAREYAAFPVEEIDVTVFDPYCSAPDTIRKDRRGLLGAWMDSGVNALSEISLFLPLKECSVTEVKGSFCKESGQVLYVCARLLLDGVRVTITVDWREEKKEKKSVFRWRGRRILVDHDGQCIVDGGVKEYGRRERLEEHYATVFREIGEGSNGELTRRIHQILFKVRELL